MRLIERVWFNGHAAKWLLVPLLFPLSVLFGLITYVRSSLYKFGIKRTINVGKPVVIVGNIGIGGNGKTPLTLYLIEQLRQHGVEVGVVSRGYGGNAPHYPYIVTDSSTANEVGDEPLLMFRRTGVKLVIGPDRVAAAKQLVDLGCDIIIADDGLQHYRLARDYEIIVIDGKRKFGNQLLLPSGPLREPVSRINSVDCVVVNGQLNGKIAKPFQQMTLVAQRVTNLASAESLPLSDFLSRHADVNAIAGIGDPERFFQTLRDHQFRLARTKGFVDHQAYTEDTFGEFASSKPLLMTEKDAVKCLSFAKAHWWYLTIDASFENDSQALLIQDILKLIRK